MEQKNGIIRCKDCDFYREGFAMLTGIQCVGPIYDEDYWGCFCRWAGDDEESVRPDDFCSRAQRSADATEPVQAEEKPKLRCAQCQYFDRETGACNHPERIVPYEAHRKPDDFCSRAKAATSTTFFKGGETMANAPWEYIVQREPNIKPVALLIAREAAKQEMTFRELELACELAVESYRAAMDLSGFSLRRFYAQVERSLERL